RPRYNTQTFETSSYRAHIPAHWPKIVTNNPRIGDKYLIISNHGPEPDFSLPTWDRFRKSLFINDEGIRLATIDEFAMQSWMKDQKETTDPTPVVTWRLSNGIEVRTWKVSVGLTELTILERYFVFKAPNGRFYTAMYEIPSGFLARLR